VADDGAIQKEARLPWLAVSMESPVPHGDQFEFFNTQGSFSEFPPYGKKDHQSRY
jgi:hypothetical protein